MGIFTIDNFLTYTLTANEIILSSTLFFIINIIILIIGKHNFKDEKRLGWAISTVNALLMTIIGIIYLCIKIPHHPDFYFFGPNGSELFHSIDNISALTSLWFSITNFCDLLFGMIFYPSGLQLLTGYIHHSVYIWMMLLSNTQYGIFMSVSKPFSASFLVSTIEEFPTFLLGLGSMFKSCRTDLGFGISFFLIRILYHGYLVVYSYYSGVLTVLTVLYSLTFLLHLHWFTTWVTKYGSKLFNQKKVKKDQ